MKVIPQIFIVALIVTVAVPISARYVPGARPWLDQVGLLQPLASAGIVPAQAEEDDAGPGQGGP